MRFFTAPLFCTKKITGTVVMIGILLSCFGKKVTKKPPSPKYPSRRATPEAFSLGRRWQKSLIFDGCGEKGRQKNVVPTSTYFCTKKTTGGSSQKPFPPQRKASPGRGANWQMYWMCFADQTRWRGVSPSFLRTTREKYFGSEKPLSKAAYSTQQPSASRLRAFSKRSSVRYSTGVFPKCCLKS